MPRISAIEVFKQMPQPTLSIRTRTKVQDLPQLIGESYSKMARYLHELGELLTDVPFVCYHNMDMQDLDVEIGFPVAGPLPEKENMKPGGIAQGHMVFCMYRGPYGEMAPVYDEMAKWIDENGYQAVGTAYEHYYNGPEFSESELLTKIVMPVTQK
ncbi:MAG: GyrI-like domain-containing protein [Christensenellales bacterium]|jgi:effector-binding domain-containing protein